MASNKSFMDQISDDYFDPNLRRFVSAEDIWHQNRHAATRCAVDVAKRVEDLNQLEQALHETESICIMRERNTIAALQTETESLIRQLESRREELKDEVYRHGERVRANVAAILKQTAAVKQTLIENASLLISDNAEATSNADGSTSAQDASSSISVKQRFAALAVCQQALNDSCYFRVEEQATFHVESKPLVTDNVLKMTMRTAASLMPMALSVAATKGQFRSLFPKHRAVAFWGKQAANDTGDHESVRSSRTVPSLSITQHQGGPLPPLALPTGLLHYMATNGGTEPFLNAVSRDVVRVHCTVPVVVGSVQDLLWDRTLPLSVPPVFRTKSIKDARIVFDFSDRKRVKLTGYLLQHGHKDEHAALRSWRLEGRNQPDDDWNVLDERLGCKLLGQSSHNEVYFDLTEKVSDDAVASYRYLSLVATGSNAAGPTLYHMELSRVEFFGSVLCV